MAFDALREYNKSPYDLSSKNITFQEVFERYYNEKYELNKKRTFSQASKNSRVPDSCHLKHASLELIVSLFKGMYCYTLENEFTDKNYAQRFKPEKFKTQRFRTKYFYPILEELGISYSKSGKKHTPHPMTARLLSVKKGRHTDCSMHQL